MRLRSYSNRQQDKQQMKWDKNFNMLKSFYFCHCKYPTIKTNKSLYQWVSSQRVAYKKGRISDYRYKILKSWGFIFDKQYQDWLEKFSDLKKFMSENDGQLPKMGNRKKLKAYDKEMQIWTDKERQNEYLLGKWIQRQRYLHKIKDLDENRKLLLESIGLSMDGYDNIWKNQYFKVFNYVKIHSKLPQRDNKYASLIWFKQNYNKYFLNQLNFNQKHLFSSLLSLLPNDRNVLKSKFSANHKVIA